ncbi:MAG: hypothetical protein JWO07_313 [Candidatus Saccharibacteria bacterium]|nr:hypothetical protein [Candidatus Saccharibacteria bacterium]
MSVERTNDAYDVTDDSAERYGNGVGRSLGIAGVDRSVDIHLDLAQAVGELADTRAKTAPPMERDEQMRQLRAQIVELAASDNNENQVKALDRLLDRHAIKLNNVDVALGRPILREWLDHELTNLKHFEALGFGVKNAIIELADFDLPRAARPHTMSSLLASRDPHDRDTTEWLVLDSYRVIAAKIQAEEVKAAQAPRRSFSPASMPHHINRQSVVEAPAEPQPEENEAPDQPEIEVPPAKFQEREIEFITTVFGQEVLDHVTTEDRQMIAAATNELYWYKNHLKKQHFVDHGKRMEYFFSDMDYAQISKLRFAERGARPNIHNEIDLYEQKKKKLKARYSPEQARMVLSALLIGAPIDWQQIAPDAEGGKPGPKTQTYFETDNGEKIARIEPTAQELRDVENRKKLDLDKYDVFEFALRPPEGWQKSNGFNDFNDELLTAIIERAVGRTRLTEVNANVIKKQLGLPVTAPADPNTPLVPGAALEYLFSEFKRNPGQLIPKKDGDRISHMTATLRMFCEGRIALDRIIEIYNKNPEAGLLLKGAIAEVLMTSMRASEVNQ